MAFRLKRRKAVGRQLSRVVSAELSSAVDAIGTNGTMSVEDVHEVRKHVKKVRAVLHLLEPSLGKGYDSLNSGLRNASRRLSALRDADASVETLEKLRARYPRVLTASVVQTLDRALKADKQREQSHAPRLLPGVVRTLKQSTRTVPASIRKAAGEDAMRSGMRRAYRRAREAMPLARGQGDDEGMHRWRRRVKDHWYHMRLLKGVNGRISGRVRRLKQLERWLGDHHNLVVLHRRILTAPARFGDARTVAAVLGCIDERRLALWRRAYKRGRLLFAARPTRFRRQIDRWWKG
jgi:CHAD domain-containing protein